MIIIYAGIIVTILIGIMVFMPASTELIVNSEGEIITCSITEIEKIKLGGAAQMVNIKETDKYMYNYIF